jgi:hypothetical protein
VSSNTLHEFVLGLLSDPTALADFQADAEGSLNAAGLADISALDVQEVLPLVLDYVPTGGLPALGALDGGLPLAGSLPALGGLPAVGSLPAVGGLPAIDGSLLNGLPVDLAGGPAGAISQLQAVTQLVSLPTTTDVNLAATGAIAADETGLEAFTGLSGWGLADVAGAADIKIPGDFSAVNDVTDTLDGTVNTATGQVSDLTDTATGALHGATATTSGVTGLVPGTEGLTSTAFGTVDTLHGVVDGVTGGLTDGFELGKTLDIGGLDNVAFTAAAPVGADTLSHVGGDVISNSGVGGVVTNVTDTLDGAHLPGSEVLHVTDLLF